MGDEWPGGGTAVNLLQYRRLDFEESLVVSTFLWIERSTLLRAVISSRDSALIARST